jgi:hypothetical protein
MERESDRENNRDKERESDREIKKTCNTRGDYASFDTGTAISR